MDKAEVIRIIEITNNDNNLWLATNFSAFLKKGRIFYHSSYFSTSVF